MASLGDLIIKVGGNVDGFRAAMVEASATADAFSGKITSSISEGITLFDAYGRAVETAVAPTESLVNANAQLAAAADRVTASMGGVSVATEHVASASGHAVTEVQAVSAAIRTFDGNGGIRAAERFIANVLNLGPAFQSIFVGVGLIAVSEMLIKIGENAYKAAANFLFLRDAEKQVLQIGKELAGETEKAFEHIGQLQAEGLRNQGKLVAAAKLEQESLLSKSIKMPDLGDEKNSKALGGIIGGIESSEYERLKNVYSSVIPAELPQRIEEINKGIARTSAEVGRTKGFDPTGLNSHFGSQARVELQLYQDALQFLQTKQQESAQETAVAGQKIGKAREEEAQKALEAGRKQSEALKAADEDQLAALKAGHQLSLGETVAFWRQRLDLESGNTQRVHEIGLTLGNLYQEQDKAVAAVAAHGAKLMEEQARKAEQWKSKLENLAEDASKLIERSVEELEKRTIKLNQIGAQSQAQGQEGASDFKKLEAERQYGTLLFQTNAAHLAMLRRVAAAEQEIAQAKIDALQKEQQEEVDPVKKAELGLHLQEATIQAAEKAYQTETRITEEKRKQSLQGRLADDLMRAPAALGNSLAAGIISGKNIGKDIAQSLRGIGQQMLGNVFNKLITTMLQQIATTIGLTAATSTNAGVTGIHAGVMLSHLGVMVAHTVVMTAHLIAIVAQTIATYWLAAIETIKAFFGFADGGSPPVGVPSIVGERGPELFIPKEAGVVIPNHMLNFAPSGAAGSVSSSSNVSNSGGNTYHFHGVQNVRDMMRQIASVAKTASPQFSPAASR